MRFLAAASASALSKTMLPSVDPRIGFDLVDRYRRADKPQVYLSLYCVSTYFVASLLVRLCVAILSRGTRILVVGADLAYICIDESKIALTAGWWLTRDREEDENALSRKNGEPEWINLRIARYFFRWSSWNTVSRIFAWKWIRN